MPRLQWNTRRMNQKVCKATCFNSQDQTVQLGIYCYSCPVSWGCRIHWLFLCRGVKHPSDKFPVYDTKQSDAEVPVMLKLWGMQSSPLLPSLPGQLLLEVVVPERVLSTGKIELNNVLMLNWIVWNRTVLTSVCKRKTMLILNCLKWNLFLTLKLCTYMLSWIVWNRTKNYTYVLNWIVWNLIRY